MTRQGILKIERTGNATVATLILLAKALGCQVSEFFPHKRRGTDLPQAPPN